MSEISTEQKINRVLDSVWSHECTAGTGYATIQVHISDLLKERNNLQEQVNFLQKAGANLTEQVSELYNLKEELLTALKLCSPNEEFTVNKYRALIEKAEKS